MNLAAHGNAKQVLRKGIFITFEGTEGSGKTTQCRRLASTLRSRGYQVLQTREPGGTPTAEGIRRLLLSHAGTTARHETMTPECETALILAARSQHVAHVIRPALADGMIVICDRFFDSTVAYQGFGRNLDRTFLHRAHEFAIDGLTPHITFLLDLPIHDGLDRRRKSKHQNRLDRESEDFHHRVRRGFLTLAKEHPGRIKKLDATQQPEILAGQIASFTDSLICSKHQSISSGRSPSRVPTRRSRFPKGKVNGI